jgi:hypothetical protein
MFVPCCLLLDTEHGEMFLRNFGWHSPEYAALYPRRQNYSFIKVFQKSPLVGPLPERQGASSDCRLRRRRSPPESRMFITVHTRVRQGTLH